MAYKIVAIGASLGGLHALEMILAGLPQDFPMAVAIAQHRHKSSDGELVDHLQRQSVLPVVEAADKQVIVGGKIYLAPADYHLLVEPGWFALSTEAPVTYARPSIDVLFESTADAFGDRAIGVILTGASSDGSQGLAKIQAYGGIAVVQEPKEATCRTMPDAAIAAVSGAKILPLLKIAPFLMALSSYYSCIPNCSS